MVMINQESSFSTSRIAPTDCASIPLDFKYFLILLYSEPELSFEMDFPIHAFFPFRMHGLICCYIGFYFLAILLVIVLSLELSAGHTPWIKAVLASFVTAEI